ncbi:MAG: helix-turn-helix domain-containing protein [Planctomycetota bacterium]
MDVLEPDPLAVLLAGASQAREALATAIERAQGAHRTLVEGPLGAGHGRVARALHRRAGLAEVPFAELHGDAEDTLERLLNGTLRGTVVVRRVERMRPDDQVELASALDGPTRWTRLIATLEHDPGSHPRGDLDPDLDYQLGVTCVALPSLSERRDDVPALAAAAVAAAALEYGRSDIVLGPATLNRLRELPLRGELDELELHLRLAVLSGDQAHLEPHDLPPHTLPPTPSGGRTLAEVERAHVESILRATQGNRARAARELGINRSTLYNKLRSWSGAE